MAAASSSGNQGVEVGAVQDCHLIDETGSAALLDGADGGGVVRVEIGQELVEDLGWGDGGGGNGVCAAAADEALAEAGIAVLPELEEQSVAVAGAVLFDEAVDVGEALGGVGFNIEFGHGEVANDGLVIRGELEAVAHSGAGYSNARR